MVPARENPKLRFHTYEEIESYTKQLTAPLLPGQYFHPPEACKGCHGFDSLGIANVDAMGNDVNLYDDWETSMMGLSAVDPFWRAKVSHEILTDTTHANTLQTLCTSCHAPMGNYTARFHNQQYYTIADLVNDTLGRAGVACMACHSIGPEGLGELFSGEIPYDTNHIEYGPFDSVMVGPMQLYVGMTPMKGDHMGESKVCASCHTLITNSVNLNGVPTGTTFTEQATYHEWINSDYPSLQKPCQSCHMPQITDPVVIANGNNALPGRSPFNLHQFAGANSFMVNLIKTNKNSLGVLASDANFDSTLKAIEHQLTNNTLIVEANKDTVINDTAYIDVKLTNKAGHKFPTGYPSRRAVLQLIATKANGDTLFASGLFDGDGEVININAPFENHYDIINDPAQVQVYEMIMGDVNGNKTTVLERAFSSLKDNRIPPLGFTSTNSAYDTTAIVGNAFADPDFNKNGITEGTGKDIVHYHIPLNGYSGTFNVSATVYYQTLPSSFLTEMFSFSSPEIDSFQQYYATANHTPVFIAKDSLLGLQTIGINNVTSGLLFTITPSITSTGKLIVSGPDLRKCRIDVFNSSGQDLSIKMILLDAETGQVMLPAGSGIYFVRISTKQESVTKKVFRL